MADYVIVGGGSAGCTLAARLQEAQPALKVLLIEADLVPHISHDAPVPHHSPLLLSHLHRSQHHVPLTSPHHSHLRLTSAVFTACGNTTIARPAAEVDVILLDLANYYRWNTFVIVAVLVSSPTSTPPATHFDGVEIGDVYNFTTQGLLPEGALTYSQEMVTVLPERVGDRSERERNYTMAWKS
ncbi:hypothetical protein MMC15_003168 [Xylographa vitiligo]|nr:hypothetical protein [Xylographa vitiligo]